jgi:hypothetical protein
VLMIEQSKATRLITIYVLGSMARSLEPKGI